MELAGRQSLNGFIRKRLFGADDITARRRSRKAVADDQLLAKLLRDLGTWDLTWALKELNLAVEDGSVRLDAETCIALKQACADIAAMRRDLVSALGLRAVEDQ